MREVRIQYFQRNLLKWFDEHQRQFPWREAGVSPYEQILSEILLQRTKVETVAKYYHLFFSRYPNWEALMQATQEELEEILRPLGLFRHRAKRLYHLPQDLRQRQGRLPSTSNELAESGFMGLYVTNAFELFVLRHRKPLLDVNMSRLLKRYFQPGEFIDVRNDKQLQALANDVIEVRRCKELNWAILDYATMVCRRNTPHCDTCILNCHCCFYQSKK